MAPGMLDLPRQNLVNAVFHVRHSGLEGTVEYSAHILSGDQMLVKQLASGSKRIHMSVMLENPSLLKSVSASKRRAVVCRNRPSN
jgi:hypothetical protein